MKDRVVFIVPARGGSKGIPRKNIVQHEDHLQTGTNLTDSVFA